MMTENEAELSRKLLNTQSLLIDVSKVVLEHADLLRQLQQQVRTLEKTPCEHSWRMVTYTNQGIVYQCSRCQEKMTRGWNLD